MESLLNYGEMYMNTMSYFHTKVDDELRQDPDEGIVSIKQLKNGRLNWKNPKTGQYEKLADITKGTAKERNSNIKFVNLFCMFTTLVDNSNSLQLSTLVDNRVWNDFGDSLLIITDHNEFFARIKRAAEERNIHVKFGLVQYENFQTYEGDTGIFVKNEKFSYQKEARFVALNNSPSQLTLTLGSLKDIAVLLDAKDTPKLSFES